MVKTKEDLTGKTFNHFTVIEQVEDYVSLKGIHCAQWLCQCDCGSEPIKVRGDALKNGSIKSCGCARKRFNVYDLSGEYGIGLTRNTNNKFYFDLEDYDKIKNYCWYETIHTNSDYHSIVTNINKKTTRMSQVVCGTYKDHINRNPLDNRKANLRDASYTENARNYSRQKNNTSGFSGVCWDKQCNKWIAYITIDKRRKKIGRFINKEDAIIARLEAEKKYFGVFAPQRHLFEEYGINDGDVQYE